MGSRFLIRLPASGSPVGEDAPEKRAEGGGPAKRILLIEDNRDLAEILCAGLIKAGHSAVTASDGREGLKKAVLFQPDVVFCDIGLPGMSGLDVARRLKNEPSLKDTVLIALTGYAGPKDQEYTREAGFDLHLAKPVDIRTMERAVEIAVKRRVHESDFD